MHVHFNNFHVNKICLISKDELCTFGNSYINCIVHLYTIIVILKRLLFQIKLGNNKMVVSKSKRCVEFILNSFYHLIFKWYISCICMNTENTNQLQLFKTNDYMKTKLDVCDALFDDRQNVFLMITSLDIWISILCCTLIKNVTNIVENSSIGHVSFWLLSELVSFFNNDFFLIWPMHKVLDLFTSWC